MKKFVHAVYAAFAAVFIFFYLNYADYLRSFSFNLFQRLAPSPVSMSKVVFISDTLTLKDYNALFDRIGALENSVALFLPQIFNIKVGDYLESIDPAEIDALKEDYKIFKIKLAEAGTSCRSCSRSG